MQLQDVMELSVVLKQDIGFINSQSRGLELSVVLKTTASASVQNRKQLQRICWTVRKTNYSKKHRGENMIQINPKPTPDQSISQMWEE